VRACSATVHARRGAVAPKTENVGVGWNDSRSSWRPVVRVVGQSWMWYCWHARRRDSAPAAERSDVTSVSRAPVDHSDARRGVVDVVTATSSSRAVGVAPAAEQSTPPAAL